MYSNNETFNQSPLIILNGEKTVNNNNNNTINYNDENRQSPSLVLIAKLPLKSLNINCSNKTPLQTPLCNTFPCLREIKQDEFHAMSPFQTPNNNNESDSEWPTPIWMKSPNDPTLKDFECKVKVNVTADQIMALLCTPNPNGGSPLTPLNELFVKSIQGASENSKKPYFYDFSSDTPELVYSFERNEHVEKATCENNGNDDSSPMSLEVKELKEILKNTVTYVSKKLSKQQFELNNLAKALGGDFIWTYKQSCTHVVYRGEINDNNKELSLAIEQNKIIVSPYWLYACQEQKQRVDEASYPCTYNPSEKTQ